MTDIKKPLPVAAGKGSEFTSNLICNDSSVDSQEASLDARLKRYYIAKQRALVNYDHLLSVVDQAEPVNGPFVELFKTVITPAAEKYGDTFPAHFHAAILEAFKGIWEAYASGVAYDFSSVAPNEKGYTALTLTLLGLLARYSKAAKGIKSCGNYLVFHQYYTVGTTKLARASFCKQHLLCPLCAVRRSAKTLQGYLDKYRVIMQENPTYRLSMITLTVKNGDNLKERFEHLQKSQKVLFDRRRDWFKKGRGKTEFRKIHGWVGTFEFTNKGKGWHPHSHIMVLHTENFDYSALIQEWKEVTQDSCNVNVTAAMNPQSPELDFIEVFKYAVKFSDLSPEQNIHAWHVLRGKRLLFSGGAFRGVEVPEELTDELLDDLPYIELFYTASLTGYQLQSSAMMEPEVPEVEILPFSKVSLDYLSKRVVDGEKLKADKRAALVSVTVNRRVEHGREQKSNFKLGYDSFVLGEKPPTGKHVQFYKGWNMHRSEVLRVPS